MPAFHHGRDSKIYYGAYDLTAQLREFNFAQEQSPVEVSPFSTEVKQFVIGYGDLRLDLNGYFSAGASDVDAVFSTAYGSETSTAAAISIGRVPQAGDPVLAIDAHETTYSITGSVADMVGVQAQFLGNGAGGSSNTIVGPGTPITTTNTSTVQDDGASAATDQGADCFLWVLGASTATTGTLAVTLETDDGATPDWSGQTTHPFAVVNADTPTGGQVGFGAQVYKWPSSTAFNRHVRIAYTVTGADGNFLVLCAYRRGTP